ncbi:MAG: TIGR03560 family F420-dependent LLM class oxidoreductase [Chloroflexi bacterium]|nr:TIGR03560 family F420-dependent LLM class oxidoreductase [Ktedonobacteraceae bacterium]MBV9020097.1 TIGR03560 family F420-dependent LLM class oxidoreductase [Ktedonobacteraceae bacterium]MBV9706815.1 TIGR03560 family F420-dependent LLM class oxidoreductase [Chloroflexota bacterium]
MTTQKRLRFGIKTAPQFTTYDAMLDVWREADEIPAIEHAWLFDHFMSLGNDPTGPCLEGWTTLAAFAAQTKRLRLGLMVTGNTYRHPAVLAKMGATVDLISQGRLDFGIGAGWNEIEHNAYDIPLYSSGERIRRLGEACEVIKLLWTEKAANFDGQYYHLRNAYCEPKPAQKPYPPFVLGGSGEKLMLRVVAQHATIWNFPIGIWNFSDGSVEEFTRKSQILAEHCTAIGRDPSTIERSVQIAVNPHDLHATRAATQGFIAAGATHLVLYLYSPYLRGTVHRLASEVVEPLQATYNA